jgi:hypothetical protein
MHPSMRSALISAYIHCIGSRFLRNFVVLKYSLALLTSHMAKLQIVFVLHFNDSLESVWFF